MRIIKIIGVVLVATVGLLWLAVEILGKIFRSYDRGE